MPSLESVHLRPYRASIDSGSVTWLPLERGAVEGFPQILWSDGQPWREANLWLMSRSQEDLVKLETVVSNAENLYAYARWLEATDTDWRSFPKRLRDRCLVKYRTALLATRDASNLASSTASSRIRVALAFYRWIYGAGLLGTNGPPWTDRLKTIKITNDVGLERTVVTRSSTLSIPNRRRKDSLEGGLTPLRVDVRDDFLRFAWEQASRELALMLTVGFFTGMRLGTITDLRSMTLLNAVPDPLDDQTSRLSVGPDASPPVATKFDVTGSPVIPTLLLEELKQYVISERHMRRVELASAEDSDLVFLTRYGGRYADRGVHKSPSINVELHRLRLAALKAGIPVGAFRFHDSRATFGTVVADTAVRQGSAVNAVSMVMDLLLQKDEASALKYIKFVEKKPIKAELANQFTKEFFGTLTKKQSA